MCNKVAYPTRGQALDDAKLIGHARRRFNKRYCASPKSGRKLRAYECRHCGGWHLTTQKKNK
jgi:hypothetical protein